MAIKNNSMAIRLLLVILAALVLFAMLTYYNRSKAERFSTSPQPAPIDMRPLIGDVPTQPPQAFASDRGLSAVFAPAAIEPKGNEQYLPAGPPEGGARPRDGFPQDSASPGELLPKDAANSKWSQANPAGQGDVKDVNYLSAGHHVGVNTQGQSLRNASHDLRSEPTNPRYKVSIWNNATIEGDLNRRPLE
jgi:hypothetical protein